MSSTKDKWSLLITLGTVLVTAVTALYLSWPSNQRQRRQYYGGEITERSSTDNESARQQSGLLSGSTRNESSQENNFSAYFYQRRPFRRSEIGDRCQICHQVMTHEEDMHRMRCGHALCLDPCFTEYPQWRRDCPYCEDISDRIDIPGDECPVCAEPMELNDIRYLICDHAIHRQCLQSESNSCPTCGYRF